MLCSEAIANIRAWFRTYENLQFLAILLLYLQIACSLIGSLGVSFTGVLLANLALALFALVAIESGSQALGRTYAVLLVCALLLDTAWFVLFSVEIRQYPHDSNIGRFTAFSLHLVLIMQILGFIIRFLSSFLWLQMYKLGREQRNMGSQLDVEARTAASGFSVPTLGAYTTGESPRSDEVLGGSIYNPAYYASLFSSPDQGHSFKDLYHFYLVYVLISQF
ncbi:hypothetical protein KP509_03G038900 [Ceratopteris richardii]|uniref:Uncharacterized protein n=1 Tax=Ceratopteris richardii TaxID=49495 RepID=A0A8T2V216_CERRI|nr:hypothetical protein KP509_03G038900 [Ceratopteris richardii]